jgi:hypothetical protein
MVSPTCTAYGLEALSAFLHDSFSHFRPSCLETGKQLEVSIELHYNVIHAGPNHLRTVESAVRANMGRVVCSFE